MIKDIIVPAFVGTSTIKWIVTRGFAPAAVVPDAGDPNQFRRPGTADGTYTRTGSSDQTYTRTGRSDGTYRRA